MNRRTLMIGASAFGIAAFAGGAVYVNRQRTAEAEAAAATAAAAPATDETLLIRPHSPILGPADAPVTLVEFFDPSCEACRAFHPVVEALREEFPTELRVVLRYTPFHQGSDEAVRILETARMQGKFEHVMNALFEKQEEWALHDGPDMDKAWRVAGATGMDIAKGKSDRLLPDITAVLNQDVADLEALGVQQTPTFYLQGRKLVNVSFESLQADIRAAVSAAA
ncbi:thioredoxin domain-containing protein [uncultured Paracoccus sp.]|uniref:DsbA family protein n=1 Tax=uncultured Paracoccus sp. TaxID=189685 RepID=UPI0026204107|nr:thioredoxin domain-containing protein [uncultured Paracoccus sp.]